MENQVKFLKKYVKFTIYFKKEIIFYIDVKDFYINWYLINM